jgi:hypothetical protein
MEMLIIAAVAIVAFAAVLIPLFRKGPRGADPGEFDDGRSVTTPASPTTRAAPAMSPAAEPPDTAEPPVPAMPVADPAHGEGRVPPLVSGPVSSDVHPAETASVDEEDEVELEVQRYRAALRAGTVCNKCGQANPADSAFCFECGAALPLSEAREFE